MAPMLTSNRVAEKIQGLAARFPHQWIEKSEGQTRDNRFSWIQNGGWSIWWELSEDEEGHTYLWRQWCGDAVVRIAWTIRWIWLPHSTKHSQTTGKSSRVLASWQGTRVILDSSISYQRWASQAKSSKWQPWRLIECVRPSRQISWSISKIIFPC